MFESLTKKKLWYVLTKLVALSKPIDAYAEIVKIGAGEKPLLDVHKELFMGSIH